MLTVCGAMTSLFVKKLVNAWIVQGISTIFVIGVYRIRFQWRFHRIVRNGRKVGKVRMTIEEWAKDFKSYVNALDMQRDDYKGIMEYIDDAIALLKEQEEMLRKLQKDKDKLCLEVSNWKHKFHDAPPTFVSQAVVEQIRWERDTALTQLDEIGKGLGSKMDDIVALLKGQEPIKPKRKVRHGETCQYQHWCGNCMVMLHGKPKFCPNCGQAVKWK